MKTLELKDICGYLPYGLHAYFEICEELYRIYGIEFNEMLYHCTLDEYDWWNINISTPVLRPLSDLYKTIVHNGKEIIPIVELAKITMPNQSWEYWGNMAVWRDRKNIEDKFSYCKSEGYFTHSSSKGAIKNYPQLFDYLHELKIDYRGLIDAKLCISCYDLPENPYK